MNLFNVITIHYLIKLYKLYRVIKNCRKLVFTYCNKEKLVVFCKVETETNGISRTLEFLTILVD